MRDLKHLIAFENLLQEANNELVRQGKADGKSADEALREGTAMVAEAGPELLSMVNGKAVVTPLTGSAVNTAADNLKGNNRGFHQEINITSPKALSPYEVARQTRIQTRAMVIAMQRG